MNSNTEIILINSASDNSNSCDVKKLSSHECNSMIIDNTSKTPEHFEHSDAGLLSSICENSTLQESQQESETLSDITIESISNETIEQSDMDDCWINSFLTYPGNNLYLKIDGDYIRDDFNLTDLSSKVSYYKYALDMILDFEFDPEEDENCPETSIIRANAKILYTLIHARFLLTKPALTLMAERYENGFYGTCPRYYCNQTKVLPVGLSDLHSQARVQIYCPSCNDVYQLPSLYHRLDGAGFGTSFPHIFFKTFPQFVGKDGLPPLKLYVPRIFGFILHTSAQHKEVTDLVTSDDNKLKKETPESNMTESISTNLAWLRLIPNYNRIKLLK